ncbi:tetratricopeptide repeat-containing sensor histidine kinase [Flavobacterium nackdongense]|uniref:histidine kinase n=1 Tax=Flavobacterium nackdongense TaxID=2547394 RepID=A0A4P6YGQ0_9FLAO|nr:tetratricopeptide repeat protein [Flavobacterium nackdongense]QBN19663.1 tetratricopeptide repeat protein [Flavobacterium nackdongense]
MKVPKLHFPIFLLLAVVLVLQSCEKKPQNTSSQPSNLTEIDRLIDRGDHCFEKVQYDSAYYYHNKAKSLCDPNKDQTRIIYSVERMAAIQLSQGDYAGSETTAIEALPLLQKTIDPAYECSIYNVLGIIYMKLYDYENALHYYHKGLNLKIDSSRKLMFTHNIAVVYMAKNDFRSALKILLPLRMKKEVIQDTLTYSKVVDNLGFSYFKLGNPKGIAYLNQGLAIKKRIKGQWGIVASYLNLAQYYKKSNPVLAQDYAQLGYEKATQFNNIDDRLEALSLLIQTSAGNESKKHSEQYIFLNDSITKVRQNARNQFAKIKYDAKKEKEENQFLKTQKVLTALELEQQKSRNLLLYFLMLIGALSTVFLYYFLKAINKKDKIQTSYDTETRIAKKLHDELANDVYHTMAFAETQDLSLSQNKELLLSNLDTIYSRTRNISKENSNIDTGLDFVSGLKEMLSSFNTDSVTILLTGMDSINWKALEAHKKIIVYRALQELLVNMKKHANCSLVVIACKKNEKTLQLDYSDNGGGAALDKINSKNGLQNVENRILAVDGTITFDTKPGKGFKSSFNIPL